MSVLLSPAACLQRRHVCCCHLWSVMAFLMNFALKRSVVLSVVSFFLYCLTFPLLLLQSPDSVHVGQVWPVLVVSASIEMAGKALGTVMIVCSSASETHRLLKKWASLKRFDCIEPVSIWQLSDWKPFTVLPSSFGDEFCTLKLKNNPVSISQLSWCISGMKIYFLSLYNLSVKIMNPPKSGSDV